MHNITPEYTLAKLCLDRYEKVNDVDVDVLSLSTLLHKKSDTVWVCYTNSLCCINPATIFQSANSNATWWFISPCTGLCQSDVLFKLYLWILYIAHTRNECSSLEMQFSLYGLLDQKIRKNEAEPNNNKFLTWWTVKFSLMLEFQQLG